MNIYVVIMDEGGWEGPFNDYVGVRETLDEAKQLAAWRANRELDWVSEQVTPAGNNTGKQWVATIMDDPDFPFSIHNRHLYIFEATVEGAKEVE